LLQLLGNAADELDYPDFDPVDYINRRFPDEDSLGGLDACIARFDAEIHTLDADLHTAVREQAMAASRAKQDLSEAQDSIQELVGKIGDIKTKAIQSEDMVQVCCHFANQHAQTEKSTVLCAGHMQRYQGA